MKNFRLVALGVALAMLMSVAACDYTVNNEGGSGGAVDQSTRPAEES